MEGDIADPAVVDLFAHEYGAERSAWLRAIKTSLVPATAQAAVQLYTAAVAAGQARDLLGDLSEEAVINTEPALMYAVSINDTTHPPDYATIKGRLLPFFGAVPQPPTVAVTPQAPAGLGGFTPAEFAEALSTREEKKESNKLRDGFYRSQSIFFKGVASFSKSTLTSIALPTPTRA